MKITRNFGSGDYTFELTFEEMEQAYREHDLSYKIMDIESRYQDLYNRECPYDESTKKYMAEDFEHALSKNDSYLESYWMSLDNIIEEFEKDKKKNDIADLKITAQIIAEILQNKGYDDITDSSGYYIIKETKNDNIAVDVHKSTEGGTKHYVIYCDYSDTDFSHDFKYTKNLSVDELFEQLKEIYLSEEKCI